MNIINATERLSARPQKPIPLSMSDPKTVRIKGELIDPMNRAMRAERATFTDFVNKGVEAVTCFSFNEIDFFIRNHDVVSALVADPDLVQLLGRIVSKKN